MEITPASTRSGSSQILAFLRNQLAEFVIGFSKLAVLALTEEEKAIMEYGKNPYVRPAPSSYRRGNRP